MSCRKYAEKRREYGELHGRRYRGIQEAPKERARNTSPGIWKGGPRKRARGSRRSGKESWLEGAEIARVRNGAGTRQKVGYWGKPKEPYARRGRDEPRTRGLGASAEVRTKKQRRESCAEGDPKTRGCGTGAGTYEQAGTRARTKNRAEGAEGKLGGGCFAFLIGLNHVSAILSSRKTTLVDKNRRYVSLPTPRRRRVQKARSCDLAFCENAATLLIGQHKSGSHIGDFCRCCLAIPTIP